MASGFDWVHGDFKMADLVKFIEDKTGMQFKDVSEKKAEGEEVAVDEMYETDLEDGGIIVLFRYADSKDNALECHLDGEYLFGIDPSGDQDEEREDFLEEVLEVIEGCKEPEEPEEIAEVEEVEEKT